MSEMEMIELCDKIKLKVDADKFTCADLCCVIVLVNFLFDELIRV